MAQLIPITTPVRAFEDHEGHVYALAVFPDRRRMVTGSADKTLRLWDLKTGVVLKNMVGHRSKVWRLAVSRDGQLIASGDESGELIAWHGETGESLTAPIKAHTNSVLSLDFSPDGTMLATGSFDNTTKLWNTKTWQAQGNPITCGSYAYCVRYSPSGEYLAIATGDNIQIYNPGMRHCVANFKAHSKINFSLAWTPDGTRLLSGGCNSDPTVREWDASTWPKQVGDSWTGHTSYITFIAINASGSLIASASLDNCVRLWRLSDRRTIAIFQHDAVARCVTFSMDGKHILCADDNKKILEWGVPEDALPMDAPKELMLKVQGSDSKILYITTTARNACIAGDLSTAEELLTQEINGDANNYTSYANRSFIMARKLEWDRALHDASKSLSIRLSLTGYISKGIALCGQQQVQDAMKVFDLAFTFTDGDLKTIHLLFLIKAIALFNANNHEEAMLLVNKLVTRPNADPLISCIVEAYLRVQLGTIAKNGALHKEAADHFTAAVNAGAFFLKLDIHSMYEDFVVLFGWDLRSLWQMANQQRCHALLRAGKFGAALESYRYMMDESDEPTKANFLAWISALDEE